MAYLISILILGLLLAFPIVVVISFITNAVMYFRFKSRNQAMEELSRSFNLTYNSGLPSFFRFNIQSLYKNFRINYVEGKINNHQVTINDTYWCSPLQLPFRYRQQTLIDVDGKNIHGNLKSFSLGNAFYLTTMRELKQLLNQLKGS